MKKYKAAICVLTYFPYMEKLIDTLQSIVKQKKIHFQIVISDDGSQENHFEKIKEYFNKVKFTDYKLIAASENQGTVKNVEHAVLEAEAEYIKLISPGDCLTTETILAEWIDHLEKSKKKWSFSDAYYYSKDEQGRYIFHSCYANPQIVDVYLRHKDEWCRWNYSVLDDIALGAATLCERDLMLRYIQEISGKVKFGEDNIYRLMVFDGFVADYFPKEAILYEYGSGISTSSNKVWEKRLQDDWKVTQSIMISRPSVEKIQRQIKKVLIDRQKDGRILYKLKRLKEKGRIVIALKRRMNMRVTNCEGECFDCK